MKVARYIGHGEVAIVEEPVPECPPNGVLMKVAASGLCSGELMDWYMDQKIPHVLGHEVSGTVVESNHAGFPVGTKIAPHHHAPCFDCDKCRRGHFVQCETWRKSKLLPGGMAEYAAVSEVLLRDCAKVDGIDPHLAALIEPIACVCKSIRLAGRPSNSSAVIGLGVMGLIHAKVLGKSAVGFELNEDRIRHAVSVGIDARKPRSAQKFDVVYVCPGSQAAFDFGQSIVATGGVVLLFAPFSPSDVPTFNVNLAYFEDVSVVTSYSAGPNDFQQATQIASQNVLRAEDFVSDFIAIEQLPEAYQNMKSGKILKPMVVFDGS